MEIRAATAAEAPGLCELLAGAGHAVSRHVLAQRLDALRQQPGAALLALEWGPPSGLVVLHWHATLDADQPVARITTLLVGPERRRRGIGRLLVKAAAQAARLAGCGALQLSSESPGLDAFCRATGFTDAGQHFVRALRKRG